MTTHHLKSRIRRAGLLLLSAFLYAGFSAAEAKELWVDNLSLGGACSDARNRDQVGPTTPWCNLGPAGDQALAGDVVTVRYVDALDCDGSTGVPYTATALIEMSCQDIVKGDHMIAWETPLPIAERAKSAFWGALGCSCFAF